MLQETALKILKSGKKVFLTGAAGTGKTYILNQYIAELRKHKVPLAITASTGIAATHIGGQTIHSWSGLGIRDSVGPKDLEKIHKNATTRKRLQAVKVLIIDEISMLSAQTLENLNLILQYFKVSFEPFGGVQVIFSGDFFQLPPVSRERIPNYEKFAFMAPIWRKLGLHICYLTEQFRQSDDDLSGFLNEIRSGEVSDSGYDQLRECLERSQSPTDCAIKLFTHNADVDVINTRELQKLSGLSQMFFATDSGSPALVEVLKKSILAPEFLELRVGAQVMFVKNNYEAGYLNGTMGTVMSFTSEGWPLVETLKGQEIIAKPVEWTVTNEFGQKLATVLQIPLRLAWAITVHKSQGMTLDSAEMDLSKTFESGQGYVALSRVKSWSGLRLIGCNQTALQLDPLALKADARFQELSQEIESAYALQTTEEVQRSFEDFVVRSGGSRVPVSLEDLASDLQLPLKQKKRSTYLITKDLIEAGKSLEEIVEIRSLSEGTIVSHLKYLKNNHPDLSLDQFRLEYSIMEDMREAFVSAQKLATPQDISPDGTVKLRLVFEALNGKYSYQEIHLAELFIEQ